MYILYRVILYLRKTSFIIILHIQFIENKLYHDKNAKHVSWTKVARASIKDFDELEEIFKSKKSKHKIYHVVTCKFLFNIQCT